MDTALVRGTYDACLVIPSGFDSSAAGNMELISGKSIGITDRAKIQSAIEKMVQEHRLEMLHLDRKTLQSLRHTDLSIHFKTLTDKGANELKMMVTYVVGLFFGILIYMVLLIYGSMVMRGVMEEKINRIAEVIVSSVKPFSLMMGKILGIGAVGILQFLIWCAIFFILQYVVIPVFFPSMKLLNSSAAGSLQLPLIFSALSTLNLPLIVGCFLFYFIGGYLLYSSLFAAVGSAVNEDAQDAQQLMLPVMMPIIFAIVILMKAVNDPTSALSRFGSLFPLTSPVVMMARIPFGIPDGITIWELLLSMFLLVLGFFLSVWFAGKIYRTGILMYGKKPTLKEICKWIFLKK